MAFFHLLVSLWPFLKEMFIGDKIKDKNNSKDSAEGKVQERKKYLVVNTTMRWCVDKMQQSKRFLTFILLFLVLSLFINYKVIEKLIVLAPRSDKKTALQQTSTTEKKELPTIPRPDNSEREVLYEQTMRELSALYGEPRK